jgi:hypothetical protein
MRSRRKRRRWLPGREISRLGRLWISRSKTKMIKRPENLKLIKSLYRWFSIKTKTTKRQFEKKPKEIKRR